MTTIGAYLRMIDVGVLGKYDRVELIDGDILTKLRPSSRHASAVAWLRQELIVGLDGRAIVSPVGLVRLPPASAPEPDLFVLTYRDDYYAGGYPEASDVHLVVEVADAEVLHDRNRKLSLYAGAGIQEMWLVDLVHGMVVVGTEPGPDGYRSMVEHRAGATIAPAAFPDVTVDVADLLR